MKKFESPQINVVKFMNDDVITTSSGYGNITDSNFDDLFNQQHLKIMHSNSNISIQNQLLLIEELFCYKRRWGFTDK